MIGKKLQDKLRSWSPIWRPGRFQATLVGLVVAAIVIPLAILAIPYTDLLNDMAVQPKGKSQGYYGWFSGQHLIAARPPVAGTMPMDGYDPYPIEGNDDAARELAGKILKNPLPSTRENIELGKHWFENLCIVCHGPHAEGNGLLAGVFPAPPSLHTKQAREFPDGRIFHVITKGQNKMPSYADKLEPRERWAVVLYVRALQLAKQMAEEDK